jgi:hypothetical protein
MFLLALFFQFDCPVTKQPSTRLDYIFEWHDVQCVMCNLISEANWYLVK